MSDWKQQIETQITWLNELQERLALSGDIAEADKVGSVSRSLSNARDVAVAAEWFSFHTPQGHVFGLTQKTKYEQMQAALYKLREVSDE